MLTARENCFLAFLDSKPSDCKVSHWQLPYLSTAYFPCSKISLLFLLKLSMSTFACIQILFPLMPEVVDGAHWFLLQVSGLCPAQCLSHLNYQPLCGVLINHLPPFFQFSNAGQFSNDQQIKSRRDQVFKMFEIPIENCLLSAALSDKSLKASGNVSRHSLILESIRIMIWCLFVRIY